MYCLTDAATIKKIMSKHGFSFSKALGQNFITNPEICPMMAEMCGVDENSGVLEIGAGIGVLTQELGKRAKKVTALELDARLIPILEDTLSDFENIEVINADVMKIDLEKLLKDCFSDCENICVCANLPYYITSPIIMLLLEGRFPFKSVTVMVQKEAGERLCAPVGTRNAGAVSVAVRYYAEAEELFGVPKECFMPSPKVDSEVIRLNIREKPEFDMTDEKFFFAMVKAAFAQRRKTALNGISAGLGMSKDKVLSAIKNANLPENIRAEKLNMEELYNLSEELYKLK
ncbi:MAG: 16S rRNA (adenine(1518)-N(6)/adenine(1519)-N(6))-dimethyltransferase RsmA [Clostridiales bacterium]|nr:16S rRNA (adenine(1518)-N(6)/adenine(1519)-N(6))-dimethyltransferase RsmA [Clostridiales bacterium]MCD7827729.1 16S rRNA (adenine(1518)-N(6)/adenine(1519)-N(6))-dimethyltransferase RsmA [Clostridiales bacterium]